MAAFINTLRKDTQDGAAACFLEGCSKLLPTLVTHQARLPSWCRRDPDATAQFVVLSLSCLPDLCPKCSPESCLPVRKICPLTREESLLVMHSLSIIFMIKHTHRRSGKDMSFPSF